MSILIDTNILTRTVDVNSPHHLPSVQSVQLLLARGETLVAVPQVFYEFWTVVTRPIASANGLGMTTQQAKTQLDSLRKVFAFIPDTPAIFDEWQRLVIQHEVKGKSAHDARLVAAMNVHGIHQILTFNGTDFARYSGIAVLDPATFTQSP